MKSSVFVLSLLSALLLVGCGNTIVPAESESRQSEESVGSSFAETAAVETLAEETLPTEKGPLETDRAEIVPTETVPPETEEIGRASCRERV